MPAARPKTAARPPGNNSTVAVILELFAGAGGASIALREAGMPEDRVQHLLVESGDSHPDSWVHRCLAKTVPGATIIPDIRELLADNAAILHRLAVDNPEAFFIIPGGFPCQDMSRAARHAKGPTGSRSILAATMAVVIRRLQDIVGPAKTIFLGENVFPKLPAWKDIMDQLFRTKAINTNAAVNSACRRRRLFWSNLVRPGTIVPTKVPKASVLDSGWLPAESVLKGRITVDQPDDKWATFCKPFGPGGPPEWPSQFWHYPLGSYTADNLVVSESASPAQLEEAATHLREAAALSRYGSFDTHQAIGNSQT